MKIRMQKILGPYYLLFIMLLLMLLVLSASRIGLFIWQAERVQASSEFCLLLLQGVRADSVMAGIWLIIPVLLAPLWARH